MKTNLIQAKETITSLEVAEMVEKEHKYLLRDIRTYSTDLTGEKISLVDFWIENTYVDSKGETRPCYLLTKKGCEFIAHKTPGKKGTIFTARYINRFHEMEKKLRSESATLQDNRLDIARLLSKASKTGIEAIKALYPEYFMPNSQKGVLERVSDLNTSYLKWIEDYGIIKDWLLEFPTTDIYNNYVRYCTENKFESMGKKIFYSTLEMDFNLTRKQSYDGHRYFKTA